MPRILVVEDNEAIRGALARRLQGRGYDVVVAPDGRRGVAMAQAEAPDLILMDLNMPDLDGWEAARQIKAEPRTSGIPIIAMTAYAMSGDEEKALEAGCDDYHSKPVEFPRLLTQMEAMLKGPAGVGN